MSRRPPAPPPPSVLSRGHRSRAALPLLLLGLLGLLLPAPLPRANAQDPAPKEKGREGGKAKEKGKDGDRGKEKEAGKGKEKEKEKEKEAEKVKEAAKEPTEAPRKTDEEILLESLAASWKRGDGKALADRLPAKRRVSLRLPGSEAGDYRAEQASSILAEYFRGRTFTKVERRSVRESAGTFAMEYERSADRRAVKADLLLVVGLEGEKRVLVSAREIP